MKQNISLAESTWKLTFVDSVVEVMAEMYHFLMPSTASGFAKPIKETF